MIVSCNQCTLWWYLLLAPCCGTHCRHPLSLPVVVEIPRLGSCEWTWQTLEQNNVGAKLVHSSTYGGYLIEYWWILNRIIESYCWILSVSWLLVSWLLGFLLVGLLVSLMLVSRFESFLVSWFPSFLNLFLEYV